MDVEARYLSEPGPVGLFTRLTRVALLVDAFQHRCLDPYGLRFIDYSVLRLLQLAGKPHRMSPTELSEIVLRSSGGMTQILDRLEKLGLVAGAPDPNDRRKVMAGLTRVGLRTAERVNETYLEARERLLEPLSEAELDELDRAIHRLLEVLHDHEAARIGATA